MNLGNSLPSNIRVIPEVKRDSEVLLVGNALTLGEEVDIGYNLQDATHSYLNKRDSIIAGSYLALGVVGSNSSQKTYDNLQTNLEKTKQTLENGTETQIKNLTKERLVGDRFVAGIQGYYAQYISQSRILSLRAKVNHQALPMAGTFGNVPNPLTLFGINRGIESHGYYMNVRVAQATEAPTGDDDLRKQFLLSAGMLSSALEHFVPEQMFNSPNIAIKPEGFSTAKALGMAMAQGQKIYTINQQNQSQVLQDLKLDSDAMSDIRASLAVGKEIITHTDQLVVDGFKGSGYAILDPDTGEGAYKISGGKNGAFVSDKDKDYLDYMLSIIAALPEKIATALSAVIMAIKAFWILDECDSPGICKTNCVISKNHG